MALGGSALGTLTLYIKADTSSLDQSLSSLERRIAGFAGRASKLGATGLQLHPTVDDSELTSLNEHLSIKQKHFSQVGSYFAANPLTPKVNLKDLQKLSVEYDNIEAKAKKNQTRVNMSASMGNANNAVQQIRTPGRAANVINVEIKNASIVSLSNSIALAIRKSNKETAKEIAKAQRPNALQRVIGFGGDILKSTVQGVASGVSSRAAKGILGGVEKKAGISIADAAENATFKLLTTVEDVYNFIFKRRVYNQRKADEIVAKLKTEETEAEAAKAPQKAAKGTAVTSEDATKRKEVRKRRIHSKRANDATQLFEEIDLNEDIAKSEEGISEAKEYLQRIIALKKRFSSDLDQVPKDLSEQAEKYLKAIEEYENYLSEIAGIKKKQQPSNIKQTNNKEVLNKLRNRQKQPVSNQPKPAQSQREQKRASQQQNYFNNRIDDADKFFNQIDQVLSVSKKEPIAKTATIGLLTQVKLLKKRFEDSLNNIPEEFQEKTKEYLSLLIETEAELKNTLNTQNSQNVISKLNQPQNIENKASQSQQPLRSFKIDQESGILDQSQQPRTGSDNLQENYKRIVAASAKVSGLKLDTSRIPNLKVDNKALTKITVDYKKLLAVNPTEKLLEAIEKEDAVTLKELISRNKEYGEAVKITTGRASYTPRSNTITITSALEELFSLSSEQLEKFAEKYPESIQKYTEDLIHEIKHSFQFDFGKISYGDLATGKIKSPTMTKFENTNKYAQKYGEASAAAPYYKQVAKQMPPGYLKVIRDTEADAANFESRWSDVLNSFFKAANTSLNKIEEVSNDVGDAAKSTGEEGLQSFRLDVPLSSGRTTTGDDDVDRLLNEIHSLREGINSPSPSGGAGGGSSQSMDDFINEINELRESIRSLPDLDVDIDTSNLTLLERILLNIREDMEYVNNGGTLKGQYIRGSARDLGIKMTAGQAEKIAKDGGDSNKLIDDIDRGLNITGDALKGNWGNVFVSLIDEIDAFTDTALDKFADFVEKIPGGEAFAKLIRGSKQLKSVAVSIFGLQMAFDALSQTKQWLDSFDEVFVDAAVEWEKFEKIIGFSSKTFNQAQTNIKFVRDEAVRLRTDLKQSMQGFSQLSAASIDTGMEGEGTKQLFSAVNQASSTYGLDAEGQSRVYSALGQVISKNTVSSEELKQQLGEILPGSFQIAARAAGKTTQEFQSLLETGQILAEDFLPKFAQQLSAETAVGVAGAAQSAQGATSRLSTAMTELQVSIGRFGMDERNMFLNVYASGLELLQKNATLVSYTLTSILTGAVITFLEALKKMSGRLMSAAAGFLATRLGITSLAVALKKLGETGANAFKSFLIWTAIGDIFQMLKSGFSDSSGKSRDFANTTTNSFKEVQKSVAEARGELDKYYASQGKKNPDAPNQKKRGQDSIIDEAPILSWVLPKEIEKDDNIFNQFRFKARQTVASAMDGLGTLTNPGAAFESVRKGDRTLMPTYANKKFQDQKRSTTEILGNSANTIKATDSALNDNELKKVKEYDEKLRQIQIKRRGLVQINPGDKQGLSVLKREEELVLKDRQKAYKPLAATQASNQQVIQALESEVEVYKEKIAQAESDFGNATKNKDKLDIQARLDYYKNTLPQLEGALKKTQDAQDAFSKSIGESVDKFALLQKQLQNVADRFADVSDRIQMIGNSAKTDLSQAVINGEMTPGQAEAGKQAIDRDILEEQLKRKKGSINEYKGLLFGADAQAILESRGIKDIQDVGQAQLGTLASKAKDGTPEKEVFTRLQDMKKMELEASDLQVQLSAVQEQAAQQIRESNKQIADYFRDVSRQAAELGLSTKEAQAQIAMQQQKNKLKSALQGFQDNFFSSFVDSLIEGMDSLNEPIMASIEREREVTAANNSKQDRDRQTADIYKSLPLQTEGIKLDFSAIDSAPVKQLEDSLKKSAEASKNVTTASKATGVAIRDSSKEASGLGDKVEDVASGINNIETATGSVTTALQDNVTAAQNVDSQLQLNRDTVDSNRMAVEEVNAAVVTQSGNIYDAAIATEQSTQTTNILQQAWNGVSNWVVSVASQTWDWFKGIAQNIPFLTQIGDMIGGWSKNLQDLIAKTWEWIKGLGDNIPFLQQIGSTVGGWGNAVGGAVQGAAQQGGNLWNQGVGAARGLLGMGEGVGKVGKFNIVESVGGSVQTVKSYKDLEKHHPSSGREYGRNYETVDGKLEEVRYTQDKRTLIKKDFVLEKGGSANVDIPAFAAGYIKRLNDAVNTVQIYADKEMTKLVGQSLHMSSVPVKTGDYVRYGQSIGKQSDTGSPGSVHAHIEMELDRFKQYVADLSDGTFEGTKGKVQEHALGDGHNHFGEEDLKKANQGAAGAMGGSAQKMLASMGGGNQSLSMGIGRAPRGGSVASAERVQSDKSGAMALVATAKRLGLKPEEFTALMSWESGGTLNPNVIGGDGNQYKGLIQFSPDNQAKYGTSKQQSIAQQIPSIEQYLKDRGFKPGQHDIRHAYSAVLAGNASERYWGSSDSNGTNVRNAAPKFQKGDHYNRAIQFLRDSGVDANSVNASFGNQPSSMESPAITTPTPTPMIAPVPFASLRGASYSGTSVDVGKLNAAQSESEKIRKQQEQQAIAKERARVEQAGVEGKQRQKQRLEQLRQSIRDTEGDRIQSTRQFRDLGLDIGIQTPDKESQRKITGVGDTYDDLERDLTEKIRKTTAGRDQAKATLGKLSSPDYVPQPGQDVAKDVEATKAAIAQAEKYLGDLTKIQGDLKTQRSDRLKFEEEQAAREKKLRQQQEKFATEEISISVLEAEAQRLNDLKGRGVRDQGVENLPKLEATITARKEELQLQQKLTEIDENARKNGTDKAVVDEQKKGLNERLTIVKKTIDENRKYAETIAGRENDKRSREQNTELARGELAVLKQRLEAAQAIGQINPLAPEALGIPEMEKTIALKEAELTLSEQIAGIEDKRFSKELTDAAADKRIADLKTENGQLVDNINKRAERATKEQEFARRRAALENKNQDIEVGGSVTEALAKNIEYGRSKGSPIAMRFDIQKAQVEASLERSLLDMDELEASGKRSKEAVDALRAAYKQLAEVSLDNLKVEQQRATEDQIMEIAGRVNSSRNGVLTGKADLLSSMGLDTQAKEYKKVAAINDQKQSYSQESLNLERFIAQMNMSNEGALELRANLSAVNEMKMEQIQAEFSTMNELMTGVQSTFESAFTSILDGSKTIGEAAMDFLKGIGSQLASMASKMITDELFGKIMGKGNKKDAEKEAGLIGKGGILGSLTGGGDNPLGQYNLANPMPVMVTNAGALGSATGILGGEGSGGGFLDSLLGTGSIFGGDTKVNPMSVRIASADNGVFDSITQGIGGLFGGGGSGGGLGTIVSSIFSGIGGGGGSAGGGGGGFGLSGLLDIGMNIFGGLFNAGGTVGDKAHIQAYARGGSVRGCGCRACTFAKGGSLSQGGLEESVENAMRRERSMSGREPVLLVANKGEFIIPAPVASRLNNREKAYLLGKSMAPSNSVANYSRGGMIGANVGNSIANNVTNNMNKSTSYRGGDITYNEAGGGINESEARRLDAAITAKTMEILQQQKRPRGLLY